MPAFVVAIDYVEQEVRTAEHPLVIACDNCKRVRSCILYVTNNELVRELVQDARCYVVKHVRKERVFCPDCAPSDFVCTQPLYIRNQRFENWLNGVW